MKLLDRIPQLWGNDTDRVWNAMRYFMTPGALLFSPSYSYGAERVPLEGGALLAANHFSGVDHFLIGAFSPRPLRFMAKAELFEMPILGDMLRWTGTFPIRRGEADRDALREARGVVSHGGVVCVHVEGTRQRTGHPGPIQYGGLSIAIMEKVPVIPCAVDTFGWTAVNRRRCAVVFGPPLSLEGIPRGRAGYAEAGELVGAELVRLWKLAVGATRAGFPPMLADGAMRNGPAAPGWRPTRDPAARV